ncbi:ExbD/TolR family protein [Alkalimarinus alittae]|uniref:Biopolymer transporter ExbD n=1 Tax=Alkalimarinus alittae TaxID=2961619 RepID=A0ABY6N780_9ALTE|nr:biopolymer transporter ExbD [Alkalimarinus alittae]UZE97951.1 biopolymer transporter ExbD [Alkalimarinus alittae]
MKFKRQVAEEISVNLTPLIDVVFLLLIFFMVSTTFTKESHLEIDLPEAAGEKSTSEAKEIELVISHKGEFSINERPLINNNEDTIKKAVQKVSGGDKKLPFIITADAKTPHEYVVRAMDVAGKLGFVHLSITTQRSGASD